MAFIIFTLLTALAGTVGIYFGTSFSGIELLWLVPIFIGFFVASLAFWALLFIIISLFIPKDKVLKKNKPFYRHALHRVVELLMLLGNMHLQVDGIEKIPTDRKFMLVSNHVSEADPIFFLRAVGSKNPLGFIAKKDIWNWIFVPNALSGINCIAIDRENDREAAKSIVEASRLLKNGVVSMAVFPEGYTEKGKGLLPFRNGVFKMAQKAETPIVVAVIKGTDRFFSRLLKERIDVSIEIIDCISEEKVRELKTAEIGEFIHPLMENALKK